MPIEQPYFSIIIPAYNRAKFLPVAINSVLAQTFSDWELIVVDDHSTDNTKEVMASYRDPRIKYEWNEKNIERSASRNKGISTAMGDYICFLDSDDQYLPEHLSVLAETIETEKDKKTMFFTACNWKFPDREEKLVYKPQDKLSAVEYMMTIQVPPSCTCFHKDILGEIQFNTGLTVNEDVELFARIVNKYPFKKIEHYTVNMYIHGGNTKFVDSSSIEKQFEATKLIFANTELKEQVSSSFKKKYYLSLHHRKITHLVEKGETEKANKSILYHLWNDPFNRRNKSYLVLLIYNLPGGGLLRKLVAATKK